MEDKGSGNDGVRRLAKNTGFLYLLSLSSQIVNLALIPFETRVLGSEAYGVIALAVAMSSIITIILDFGFILSATERTVKIVGDARGLACLLGNVACAKACLALVVGFVVGVLVLFVQPFSDYRSLFLLYYLAYAVNAFLPDFFYRGHEDMRVITVRTVMVKVVSALPVFFLLRDPSDMWVVPALLLVGNAAAVMFSYFDIRKRYRVRPFACKASESLSLLRESFGFFVSRFASVFYQSMNSVLLGSVYPGQAIVGCYGAAEKFLSYSKALSSPVADSLYPYMVRTRNYGLCIKVLLLAMPFVLSAAVVAWAFAEPICLFAFGKGYEGSAELLRCLIPAIVVILPTYVLCFPMLVPMGLSRYANRSNVIGAIVQIALVGILFATSAFDARSLCLAASASEVSVFLYRLWVVWSHRSLIRQSAPVEED